MNLIIIKFTFSIENNGLSVFCSRKFKKKKQQIYSFEMSQKTNLTVH